MWTIFLVYHREGAISYTGSAPSLHKAKEYIIRSMGEDFWNCRLCFDPNETYYIVGANDRAVEIWKSDAWGYDFTRISTLDPFKHAMLVDQLTKVTYEKRA